MKYVKKSEILIRNPKSFAIVDNLVLRNQTISLQSKGLYALLCGFSDKASLGFSYLQKLSSNGRDALRNAFKELENVGAIERWQTRDDTGKYITVIELKALEEKALPANLPLTEKPSPDNRLLENRRRSAASGKSDTKKYNKRNKIEKKEEEIRKPLSKSLSNKKPKKESGKPQKDMAGDPHPVHDGGKPPRDREGKPSPVKTKDGQKPVKAGGDAKQMSYYEFVEFIRSHSHLDGRPISFEVSGGEEVFLNERRLIVGVSSKKVYSAFEAEKAFKSLFRRRGTLIPTLTDIFSKKGA